LFQCEYSTTACLMFQGWHIIKTHFGNKKWLAISIPIGEKKS